MADDTPKLKLAPVVDLPCITSLDLDTDRVLQAAREYEGKLQRVLIIGQGSDGELYFASSYSDGGTALWDMELAKHKLMGLCR